MRYSLSGPRESELRAGQRVEIIGRVSGAQNRGTTGQGADTNRGTTGQGQGAETNRGTADRTPPSDISRDDPNRVPDVPGNEPGAGTRTDTSRQTAGATSGGANMQMLEIVSYRAVPGDCANNNR
jgi:hypothetical protein